MQKSHSMILDSGFDECGDRLFMRTMNKAKGK